MNLYMRRGLYLNVGEKRAAATDDYDATISNKQ